MWRYEQSTGRLWHLVGTGYSGRDEAKNQPGCEAIANRGPIPHGNWAIVGMYDSDRRGALCLRLEPKRGTETHGRSAFLIHGDSKSQPGTASEGCIILSRDVRQMIWASSDRDLEVVP